MGGSVHNKEAGREDSAPKSFIRCHADAVSLAEGSIRQDRFARSAGVAGVPSPGHVFRETGQEPKRAPHPLAHQEENLWVGRAVYATEG